MNLIEPDAIREIRVGGTGEMVAPVILDVARELGMSDRRLTSAEIRITDNAATQTVFLHLTPKIAEAPNYTKLVPLQLRELPQNRSLVRIPDEKDWETTSGPSLRSRFVEALVSELKRLGFISDRSRFSSASALQTAVTQLASADDPHSYAAVGNVCRSALVALANELYQPYMLPAGAGEPKGDDAKGKLKYAARHYAAGHSSRQSEGLGKVIEGVWTFTSAAPHRKNATRREAELCVTLVTAVFDSFVLIVP